MTLWVARRVAHAARSRRTLKLGQILRCGVGETCLARSLLATAVLQSATRLMPATVGQKLGDWGPASNVRVQLQTKIDSGLQLEARAADTSALGGSFAAVSSLELVVRGGVCKLKCCPRFREQWRWFRLTLSVPVRAPDAPVCLHLTVHTAEVEDAGARCSSSLCSIMHTWSPQQTLVGIRTSKA